MDVAIVLLFFAVMYALCGYVSKKLFEHWCANLLDDWRLADAASVLLAIIWPIGWALMIIIGIIAAIAIFASNVIWSFKVIREHFRQSERGEQ